MAGKIGGRPARYNPNRGRIEERNRSRARWAGEIRDEPPIGGEIGAIATIGRRFVAPRAGDRGGEGGKTWRRCAFAVFCGHRVGVVVIDSPLLPFPSTSDSAIVIVSRARALLVCLSIAVAAPAVEAAEPAPAARTAPVVAPAAQPTPAAPVKAKPDEIQQKLDAWKTEIDQIAAGAQRDGQTDRRLAEVRERVDAIRKSVLEIEATETPRAAAFDNRLKQLGPAPAAKDDEPAPQEADAVRTEREEQQRLFSEADGRVKQAALIRVKADEIIKTIADKRRDRFASQMAERSRSILDPTLWLEAVRALPSLVTGLGFLLGDWLRLLASRGVDTAVASGSVVLALLGVVWLARRRLTQLTDRDPDLAEPPVLRRAAAAAGIVLVNISVPVLGLWGIAKALETFDLNPPRIDLFLMAIIAGVAAAATIYGIALAVLAPGKPQWRLAPVGDHDASRLLHLFVVLAAVHGVGVWLVRLMDVLAAPVAALILASGLFALIDAGLVMASLKAAARAMAGEEASEKTEAVTEGRSGLWRWAVPFGWVAAIGAIVAVFAGYVALGSFITQQMIRAGFLLGALYILLVLVDEAIQTAFDERSRLHRVLTRSMGFAPETVGQIGVVLSGAARLLLIAVGVLVALTPIGVDSRDVLADAKVAFFGFKIGGLTFSLSNILTGIVFLIIGVAVTRGVQGWLDQRFLPKTRLDVGLKNSIRTAFGYTGYVVAVALGFSVVGLDLQNIAIVAGALSVGVGFGLQSIVNNFVSGLILLVERPIKAGDLVELGAEKGFVRKINVRSTEIETFDRASLIVPNSSLISGNVKNWMHRDLTGRCVVNVGVSYEADPAKVREVLLTCAGEHHKVLKFPAPSAFFINFGDSALEFRLMCTVANVTDAFGVESDLRFAIMERLRDLGIEIPYAQRDINIRQLGDIRGLVDQLVGHNAGPGPGSTPSTEG